MFYPEPVEEASFFRSNKQVELSRVLGAMGANLSYFDGQSEEGIIIID